MTTPTPGPRGAAARLAELAAQQEAAQRARDDELLAEADRLGDHAPELIREAAADIREHRQMEARRHEGAARDAEQTQTAVKPRALVVPPWHLTAPEAVEFAGRIRQEHPDVAVRAAAKRLLDRHDTITSLAMYRRGVVDPDKLHHVVEDMRQLAYDVSDATHAEPATAGLQHEVSPVWAEAAYVEEFRQRAAEFAGVEDADQWYRMGVTARDAAAWASAGFTPTLAEHHIAGGRTLQEVFNAEADWDRAVNEPVDMTWEESQRAGPVQAKNDAMEEADLAYEAGEISAEQRAQAYETARQNYRADLELLATGAERDDAAEDVPLDPTGGETDPYRAEVKRLLDRHDAALAKVREHLDKFQRQLTEAEATAARYEAERARIQQATTTAAAELRAQADLDRISEQVERHHGDGEAPFRAEPVAEDVQEVGR